MPEHVSASCKSVAEVEKRKFVKRFHDEILLGIWDNAIDVCLKCRTSPMHLLWTLLFLKTYGKESIMSTIVEADEKTVRKWVWHIAELIADMDNDVVSNCFG